MLHTRVVQGAFPFPSLKSLHRRPPKGMDSVGLGRSYPSSAAWRGKIFSSHLNFPLRRAGTIFLVCVCTAPSTTGSWAATEAPRRHSQQIINNNNDIWRLSAHLPANPHWPREHCCPCRSLSGGASSYGPSLELGCNIDRPEVGFRKTPRDESESAPNPHLGPARRMNVHPWEPGDATSPPLAKREEGLDSKQDTIGSPPQAAAAPKATELCPVTPAEAWLGVYVPGVGSIVSV